MGRRSKEKKEKTQEMNLPRKDLPEGVLCFQGLRFKKAGFDLARHEGRKAAQSSTEHAGPTQSTIEEKEYTEQTFYPLGVYLFDIITNMDVYIHVSLFEVVKFSSSSNALESLQNCRWIRVGYTVEDEEEEEEEEEGELRGGGADLKSLIFLPNQIARAILSLDTNYVDLAAISPKEYYMANYLQNIYRNLCNRVYIASPDRPTLCDQWCLLEMPEEREERREEREEKRKQSNPLSRSNIITCRELEAPKVESGGSIRFDSTITQVSDSPHSLSPLSRIHSPLSSPHVAVGNCVYAYR